MTAPNLLTLDQLQQELDSNNAAALALDNQRRLLEAEIAHRADDERCGVFNQFVTHPRFTFGLDAQISVRIRVPDWEWIEGDDDAEVLYDRARNLFSSGTLAVGEHRFNVSFDDKHILLTPVDGMVDLPSWAALFNIVKHRMSAFYIDRTAIAARDVLTYFVEMSTIDP